MIEFLCVAVALIIFLLVYFKFADKYNIIDKPNHRSAHTEVTLRGGGIVYPLAFILFLVSSYLKTESVIDLKDYLIFGSGLLIICGISFIDDIVDLSSKIRLLFHFVAVTLLLFFINAFQILPAWAVIIAYILIIGILNAYNFMDGINGMTGCYTSVVLGSLWYVNANSIQFTDTAFIIYPLIASLVFLIFNFRKKARCFMGDIGSLGIAFWVLGLIGLLILKSESYKYILFLTVYGIEVIFTILQRLKLKENIFEAHRHHLYQLFANDKKVDHRIISLVYSVCQIIISTLVVALDMNDFYIFLVIVIPCSIFYLFLKSKLKKQLEFT